MFCVCSLKNARIFNNDNNNNNNDDDIYSYRVAWSFSSTVVYDFCDFFDF